MVFVDIIKTSSMAFEIANILNEFLMLIRVVQLNNFWSLSLDKKTTP